MAISQFFFPGNLATFKHIFHKNALYESPTGFVFGHQVTRISHKKREENAHLISHVWLIKPLMALWQPTSFP
jgi:hypothetical protein